VAECFLCFCRVESMNLLLQSLTMEGSLPRGTTQLMPDTRMVGGYDLMMHLFLLLEQIRCCMIKPMSSSTDSCENIHVVSNINSLPAPDTKTLLPYKKGWPVLISCMGENVGDYLLVGQCPLLRAQGSVC